MTVSKKLFFQILSEVKHPIFLYLHTYDDNIHTPSFSIIMGTQEDATQIPIVRQFRLSWQYPKSIILCTFSAMNGHAWRDYSKTQKAKEHAEEALKKYQRWVDEWKVRT